MYVFSASFYEEISYEKTILHFSLLLALVLNICACAQSAPEEEKKTEETLPAVEDTVKEEPVAEEQGKEQKQAPVTEEAPVEEPLSEDLPAGEEGPTEEEKALAAFMGVEELPDLTPEKYEELVAVMKTEQGMAEYMGQTQQTAPPAGTSTEKPTADPETGLTQRSDVEVKEVINDFVGNFKNTATFHNLTGAAAEHVDDNLDIIKNNPESDESLSIYIRDYKCGALTEEEFVFLLNSWMKAAGLYGDKIIVVQ